MSGNVPVIRKKLNRLNNSFSKGNQELCNNKENKLFHCIAARCLYERFRCLEPMIK